MEACPLSPAFGTGAAPRISCALSTPSRGGVVIQQIYALGATCLILVGQRVRIVESKFHTDHHCHECRDTRVVMMTWAVRPTLPAPTVRMGQMALPLNLA